MTAARGGLFASEEAVCIVLELCHQGSVSWMELGGHWGMTILIHSEGLIPGSARFSSLISYLDKHRYAQIIRT